MYTELCSHRDVKNLQFFVIDIGKNLLGEVFIMTSEL